MVLLIVLILGLVILMWQPWSERDLGKPLTASHTQSAQFEASTADSWVGQLPEELAHKFTHTSDPQERLKLCRDPKRVTNLLASFPAQALSEVPRSVIPMGSAMVGTLSYERFAVTFSNGENRLLCVVRTDEGPKIDWEAYARHGNAFSSRIEENKTAKAGQKAPPNLAETRTAEVRVFASSSNYYNYRFSDDKAWRSYSLSSPDWEGVVTAYAAAGSITARILDQALRHARGAHRVTLQLRSRPQDALRQQFEIEKVSAVGWVRPEGDFEDNWLSQQQRLMPQPIK